VAFLQGAAGRAAAANLPATSSLNQMVTLSPDVRREAHVVELAKQIVTAAYCLSSRSNVLVDTFL
jgi:hypothetical protein